MSSYVEMEGRLRWADYYYFHFMQALHARLSGSLNGGRVH